MPHTQGLIGTYRQFWEDPPDEVVGDARIWYHRTQMVTNSGVYPVPDSKPESFGRTDFVYAEDDPRRALETAARA